MSKYTMVNMLMASSIGIMMTACGEESTPQKNVTEEVTTINSNNKSATNEEMNYKPYVSPLGDDAPVYKVGLSAGYAPFEFKDEFGHVIGYDIDMVRSIGEESGFKVEFYDIPFSELETSLREGKYDFGMSSSFKGADVFISSDPYIRSRAAYMVKKDSGLTVMTDLDSKKVAVQAGTSLEAQLKENSTITIVPKDSVFLAIQAIFTGKADAVLGEDPILFHQLKEFEEHPIRIIFTEGSEKHRVIVSAVENKQEIIDKVNAGIKKVKANGRYQEINKKWFDEHAASLAVN